MKYLYLLLAVLGAVLPYLAFVGWVSEFGFSIPHMLESIWHDKLSLFAWLDVIIAAVTLLIFILIDGYKNQIRHRIWAIVATCTIGVSCGLPLYLYLRERALEPPWR